MTDFNTIQPAFSQTAATQATSVQAQATLSSDFETFLKMLTVQMQNQDPLNPVESSEYAVQLATFSSVEQQVLTNDLLATLVGQSSGNISQIANWVGMDIRVAGSASFDGEPVAIWAEPAPGAVQADLVVRDSGGNEITRTGVEGSGGRLTWDGHLVGGGSALHGAYRFEIESRAEDGTVIDVSDAEIYTRVVEVQSTPRGLELLTESGDTVPASAVTGLRQA
ncbi:flagellar hook assembly protein FlgD [Lutimaribacter sp. EGI FJ00015]|uniref:Flagellar hook assembly protein FlgD n=1 Tax=Lutimaribacter degradans TaxID=2945989 RepID=A0ACC5ZUV2_9RHOB|nr:flagellar hook capping FlgD N-terminal domain-containing protein [Lutimaribacter sp. EGI FJ00013]MCM2561885.1 flagellar hook assembly protein FlgD [Lutimaribacter sp. EGI FJ00013]MCO0613083.1 flagellar hook assembly protein FlgD [Lutimaribacter sp. EGI FJ00015]MCO0635717.1 flagellar hook assembly protein FlgD [Lutimaribacter sp. EGI FJ00014]